MLHSSLPPVTLHGFTKFGNTLPCFHNAPFTYALRVSLVGVSLLTVPYFALPLVLLKFGSVLHDSEAVFWIQHSANLSVIQQKKKEDDEIIRKKAH